MDHNLNGTYPKDGFGSGLNERRKAILAVIVESYIETAEPVGSRTIAKMGQLGLSPATIRNTMADLEEMGLLEQPHASAGRVPSHLGYRIYVDQLMNRYQLSAHELARMHMMLQLRIAELEGLIRELTGIYARYTNYAVLSTLPTAQTVAHVLHVQILPLSSDSLMLIVVLEDHTVRDKVLENTPPPPPDVAVLLSASLTELLSGFAIDVLIAADADNPIIDDIRIIDAVVARSGADPVLIADVFACVQSVLSMLYSYNVYTGGTTNLLDFPEYNNINKAKALLGYLEDKSNLHGLLRTRGNANITIRIGHENEALELHDCSIVLSRYTYGGQVGVIGIIGPTRMDYARAIGSLEAFTDIVNKLVEKNLE